MINAETLRLGSVVEQGTVWNIGYNEGKLGCWINRGSFDSSPGKWYNIEDITPVEITDEKLSEWGFELDSSTYSWSILIPLERTDFLFELDQFPYKEGYYYNGCKLNYLHEIQGICLYLTGYDLESNFYVSLV